MSLHSDTLLSFRANQSMLLHVVWLAEKQRISIAPGLEPTIHSTRGEHANRYIIDTIPVFEDRVDHKKKVEHV